MERVGTPLLLAGPTGVPHQRRDGSHRAPVSRETTVKTTVQMKKKITVRRTGDIRLTTMALCSDSCYCTHPA